MDNRLELLICAILASIIMAITGSGIRSASPTQHLGAVTQAFSTSTHTQSLRQSRTRANLTPAPKSSMSPLMSDFTKILMEEIGRRVLRPHF